MTTEQEAELVNLLAEATPRPWTVERYLVDEDDHEVTSAARGHLRGRRRIVAGRSHLEGPIVADIVEGGQSAAHLIVAAVNLLPALLEERRALKEALKDTLRQLGEPVALPPAPDHPSCGAWANCDGACADYGHAVQHNAAVLKARAALALAARPVEE